MEITKREVLASIVIAFLMLAIGCAVSFGIKSYKLESDRMVHTAVHIDGNAELFEYGMRTGVGRALVYGDLVAVHPVGIESIPGEYMRVTMVTEQYTKHTPNKKEVYYSWDEIDRDSWHCDAVTFLGHVFPYGVIPVPMEKYIGTVSFGTDIRYVYYASDAEYTGTAYGVLRDGGMECDSFCEGKTIDEAEEYLTSDVPVIAFMFLWLIFIAVVIAIFVQADNDWLK